MLGNLSTDLKVQSSLLKKQLAELKSKKEKLEERFAFGDINEEMYKKFNSKISSEIASIKPDLIISQESISNLQNQVDLAVDFACNIQKYWKLERIEQGKMIFFELSGLLSIEYKNDKKGLSTQKSEKSSTVAGTRVELVTSGL